jgi:hypothetical protein
MMPLSSDETQDGHQLQEHSESIPKTRRIGIGIAWTIRFQLDLKLG